MIKTDVFQTIEFCINRQFKCQTVVFDTIRCYHSGAEWARGTMGIEGVLHISLSSRTGTLQSNHFVLYPRHSLWGMEVLLLYRDAVGVFYNPSRLV